MSAQADTHAFKWVSVLHRSKNSFVGVPAENPSFSLTGRKIINYSIYLLWVYTLTHKEKKKTKPFSLVNSSMFWAHWDKGSFSWTHTYKAHTKKEVNACRKLNWNILQSWCHDSPLFLYTKRRSWRTEEAEGDEGMRGERRTLPPIGRRKLEETDIRQSVLKTGRHPPSLSLCLTHSSLLTPRPPSNSSLLVFLLPPASPLPGKTGTTN